MSYTYDQRKRPQGPQSAPPEPARGPVPDLDALMTGAVRPTAAQKGRPIDLDGAMRAKMEHAFGDLSAVKLYESRAVGDAGAEAIAQGNEIAFAPGMANFSTRSGQERLGHELSHVMSQRSGAVRGQGFLASAALEARADREGAMAAAGEQVYTGPVSHALSDASPSPAAAGPMQAKRGGSKEEDKIVAPPSEYKRFANTPELSPLDMKKQTRNVNVASLVATGMGDHYNPNIDQLVPGSVREGRKKLYDDITGKINKQDYVGGMGTPQNSDKSVTLTGSGGERMIKDLWGSQTEDLSDDEFKQLFEDMYAPQKKELHQENTTPEQIKAGDKQFDRGMLKLKDIYYKQLKRLETTYGTLPTQMHPQDFLSQVGPEFREQAISQDWAIFQKEGGKYFDENDEKDQEFKRLANYYSNANNMFTYYQTMEANPGLVSGDYGKDMAKEMIVGPEQEAGIGGPKMNEKQMAKYKRDLNKRAKKGGWKKKLFGRFL